MTALRRLLSALLLAGAALPGAAAAQATDSTVVPAATATSALDGTVVDALNRPLAGAVVLVDGGERFDVSTERGRFALTGLQSGPRRFLVRRVGYRPVAFEVDLPEQATVHVSVRLEMNVVMLGTVVIEGQAHSLGLWRTGFYDRATRQASGYFYPPEEILRRNLSSVATLLIEVPGLQIETNGNRRIALGRPVGADNCPLNLWVDGALAAGGPADLDELAPGSIVRAVEVYPSASAVPGRYARPGNKCGAILVWTKGIVRNLF